MPLLLRRHAAFAMLIDASPDYAIIFTFSMIFSCRYAAAIFHYFSPLLLALILMLLRRHYALFATLYAAMLMLLFCCYMA